METVADVIPTRDVVAEFFFCRPRQQWRMETVADVVPIREVVAEVVADVVPTRCLLYTSPSPRDKPRSRMPSSA